MWYTQQHWYTVVVIYVINDIRFLNEHVNMNRLDTYKHIAINTLVNILKSEDQWQSEPTRSKFASECMIVIIAMCI